MSTPNHLDATPVDLAQARHNFRVLVLDIAWFALAFPATARFLAVYLIRLDASPTVLGWQAALPAVVALVTSSFAGWWRGRYSGLVQAMFWPALGYRLMFLLPAFTPFLPHEWQAIWLVVAVVLPAIPQGVSTVLFLVALRESVEPERLSALMSRRSMVFNILFAVATLAMGFWLEVISFPVNYQFVYLAAFGLSMGSLYNVTRVRPIIEEPPPPTDRPVTRPWQSPSFRRVAFVTVMMHVAFFSITPLVTLRLVSELGADEGFMSIFTLAELAAAATGAALTNRLVARVGNRAIIAGGLIGTGVAGLLLAASPTLPLTLIAAAISGASWTTAAISAFNYFSQSTPVESVTRFTTVYNQLVMLSIFVGPMLGSQLAETALSVSTVMGMGSVLRLAAGAVIVAAMSSRISWFGRERVPV